MIMNVQITARNFNLTQGIKEAIHNKLMKLEKFLNPAHKIYVTSEITKYGHKIDVSLLQNGVFVKAEDIDEDLYTAIDFVFDKLIKKLKKLKKLAHKRLSKSQDSLRYCMETLHEEGAQAMKGVIVKRKKFEMKPMLEEEAILQMELLGHKTFMFYNAEKETMCLLYKRNDGNYGMIESS